MDAMPEVDVLFSPHPAEEYVLTFTLGEEIHQTGSKIPNDDALIGNFAGEVRGPGHGALDSLLGRGYFLLHATFTIGSAHSIDFNGSLLVVVFLLPGLIQLEKLLGEPWQEIPGLLEGEVTLRHCSNTIAR